MLTIAPADHAENVPLSSAIVVTLSESINPASLTPASVVLAGPDGTPIVGTLSLSNNNSVVTLRPAAALPADTAFTVTVAASIADLSGYTLAQAVSSRFTSLDITAPLPPPAGSISASIPGADGLSTITAAQGTAGPRDTVSIVNVTRGTTAPVLVDPAGGFTATIAALLGDHLQIRIVDAAGNVTLVELPRFSRSNADGSVSVAIDKAGGRVDGPGGVSASIRPDTFPDGAIVTIKAILESEFPVAMTPEQQEVFSYAGGVQLDFGGQVPTQYVNVSVPSTPDDRPDNQWVVGLVKELNGEQVLHVVDTAKLIDGKVTTSSPPCPGVNAAGKYGLYKAKQPLGLSYGDVNGLAEPTLLRISADVTNSFIMPLLFLADAFQPQPVCLPVLSGRVTIVPNSVTIRALRDDLHADLASIVVTNLAREEKTPFSRGAIDFQVTGREASPTPIRCPLSREAAPPVPSKRSRRSPSRS